jgi:hypothetical protein
MSKEIKGWDRDNYQKFQELFKKYRLPKNYDDNKYNVIKRDSGLNVTSNKRRKNVQKN